jgi:hypothetical protein
MPAKAGIQGDEHRPATLDPRFRGDDGRKKWRFIQMAITRQLKGRGSERG